MRKHIFSGFYVFLLFVFRFSEKLIHTKENAVEHEMPILPPFVEQEEEEEEEKEEKEEEEGKTEPELEEKVDSTENKEEKGSGHVDLSSSVYFAKHPKAIANPQERSVSLLTNHIMDRKFQSKCSYNG